MHPFDLGFLDVFAGRMRPFDLRLGDAGRIVAFLGCALALFGVFAVARRCSVLLPRGGADDPPSAPEDVAGVTPAALSAIEARLRGGGRRRAPYRPAAARGRRHAGGAADSNRSRR